MKKRHQNWKNTKLNWRKYTANKQMEQSFAQKQDGTKRVKSPQSIFCHLKSATIQKSYEETAIK